MVFNAYGGYICKCCGESNSAFLVLDHVNGNGNKHRKEIGTSSTNLQLWLKKNNYPEGFQVLCYNCNNAKYYKGICPHKTILLAERATALKSHVKEK